METLGKKLKAARQKRKLTTSEAAKGTRIKIQHIEAIENDDFSSIAAPTYAKGFIRIYAEFLGLNPEPLIEEYTSTHLPKPRASLIPEESPKSDAPRKERTPIAWPTLPRIQWPSWQIPPVLKDLWKGLRQVRWCPTAGQLGKLGALAVVVALVVALFVVVRRERPVDEAAAPTVLAEAEGIPLADRRPAIGGRSLPVIEALPDPYME